MSTHEPFSFEKSETGEVLKEKTEIRERIDALLKQEGAMVHEFGGKNLHAENTKIRQMLTAIVLTTALAVGGMKEALGESASSRETSPQNIEEVLKKSSDVEILESEEFLKDEIIGIIERNYLYSVDTQKLRDIPLEKFFEEFSMKTDGKTARHLDEYSGIESVEREKRLVSTDRYGGVGANFSEIDGEIFITSINPEGPAEKADLRAGDKIISVQDEKNAWHTDHKNSLNDFLTHIRGEINSGVVVAIERNGARHSFSLERKITRFKTVRKKIPEDGIGYIRISQFAAESAKDFFAALEFFRENGSDNGLIIDLRNNSWGLERAALEIIWPFLADSNAIVLTHQYNERDNGMEVVRARDIPDKIAALSHGVAVFDQALLKLFGTWADVPVEILLNKKTASAAEFVADVLHESGKAGIVGVKSRGKAVGQVPFYLRDGRALWLTVTKLLYGEQKHDIDKKGITPDVSVAWEKDGSQSDSEFTGEYLRDFGNPEKDPQLKTALEILHAKIK